MVQQSDGQKKRRPTLRVRWQQRLAEFNKFFAAPRLAEALHQSNQPRSMVGENAVVSIF